MIFDKFANLKNTKYMEINISGAEDTMLTQ